MADDIELLRLRAKARLKLRGQTQQQEQMLEVRQKQRVPTFTEQRFPFFTEAAKSLRQGETIAGGLDIANQMFSEVSRPFQLADEKLRQVPVVGKPLSNIARIPSYLAGKAVELGTSAISATGIPQALNSLLPIDESGRIAEALNRTNQSIAPFLVAPPMMKGILKTPEVIGRGTQAVADALSQSAYKIPPSVKAKQRTEILRTAQKEKIVPDKRGIEKLDSRVSELKGVAEGLEKQATGNLSQTVAVSDMVKSIDKLSEKWSKSDTPKDFQKILDSYRSRVLEQQKPELTVQEMIDLKRNLQSQLSDVYNKQMKINPNMRSTLLKDAKSALEVSVRRRLEDIIPEYRDVNSQIHKLLKLKPYVEQAANRISNQDLTTIRLKDIMLGGGGAYALTNDPVISVATAIILGKVLTDQRMQAYIGNKIAPSGRISRMTSAIPVSTGVMQLPLNTDEER